MKRLAILSLFIVSSLFAKAQDYLGFINSNYAGITAVHLNPANLADNRMIVDVDLIGMDMAFSNNYISIKHEALKKNNNYLSPNTSTLFSFYTKHRPAFDNDSTFEETYLTERLNGDKKSVYLGTNITLPSFMITLDAKSAIGFSWRERNYVNVDGIEENLARQIYSGIDDTIGVLSPTNLNLFDKEFHNKNLSIQYMSWAEYGGTYARVLMDEGSNFLKAGATLKVLQGLGAAYMFVDDLNYKFSDHDTLSIFNTEVSYGHSTNFEFDENRVKYKYVSNFALGGDLGVVYEYRPERDKFKYDMDGETGRDMKWKDKYKLKAGVSIIDMGGIKFKKGAYSHNFHADVQDWYTHPLNFGGSYTVIDSSVTPFDTITLQGAPPITSFDDTLQRRFVMEDGDPYFKMNLPTTINLTVDYNIWKTFYANITYAYAFKWSKNRDKVHDISTISFTPRWDYKWFGAFVPLSYNAYRNFNIGACVKLGPIIVGTNSLTPFITKKDIYGFDMYFLLKVPIPYGPVRDKDKDKVSNKKDKCKDIPGVWEFLGCPDRDGDHIPDKVDDCPDDPGIPQFNGCPDRDGDGIMDKNDSCPDNPGLKEFYGCPDRDGDRIIDKRDSCPDEPGLIEFNGCPDKDGDGLMDKKDRCPEKPGPISNEGCPEQKLYLVDKSGNILSTVVMGKDGSFVFEKLPHDSVAMFMMDPDEDPNIKEIKVGTIGTMVRLAKRGKDNFFRFDYLKPEPVKQNVIQTPDVAVKLNKEEEEIVKKAFNNLEFETGKAIIKATSFDELTELAKLMMKKPAWRLKISGHTDNVGKPAANMTLSKNRANALALFLESKGVDPSRFVVKWYGQTMPIKPNTTPEGRQKNRRVEMLIIE